MHRGSGKRENHETNMAILSVVACRNTFCSQFQRREWMKPCCRCLFTSAAGLCTWEISLKNFPKCHDIGNRTIHYTTINTIDTINTIGHLLSPSVSSLSFPVQWRGSWPPHTRSPTGRQRQSWPRGKCPPPWCRRPVAWRRWRRWWWWTWSTQWWCLQSNTQTVMLFFFLHGVKASSAQYQ